jgi:hypothetical protein
MTNELSKALGRTLERTDDKLDSEDIDLNGEVEIFEEVTEPFALTENFGKSANVDWWGGTFSEADKCNCANGCDCSIDESEDVEGLDLE